MRVAPLVLVAACWHDPRPATPFTPPPPTPKPAPAPLVIAHHEVRAPGDAPSIELAEALAVARRYAAQHAINFDEAYLQGAVFDAAERRWVFDWQVPNAATNVLYIFYVNESGAIEYFPPTP